MKSSESQQKQSDDKAVTVIRLCKVRQTKLLVSFDGVSGLEAEACRRMAGGWVEWQRTTVALRSNMHSVLQCFYSPAEEEKLFTAASLKYSAPLRPGSVEAVHLRKLQSSSWMVPFAHPAESCLIWEQFVQKHLVEGLRGRDGARMQEDALSPSAGRLQYRLLLLGEGSVTMPPTHL